MAMTDGQGPPRKRWFDVKEFVARNCRATEHESEQLAETVLYAHYRKHAFFADRAPLSEGEFGKRLATLSRPCGEHRGVRLFPLRPLGASPAKEAKPTKIAHPLGQVELLVTVRFADGVLSRGETVPYHQSTKAGKVEIVWKGKRREIGADVVRRLV